MTDNEIVKALEYWKQFNKDIDTLQSTHPQYADMWDEQKEVVKITFEVFESFNRQKADIEELKSKNSNLTSDLSSLRNDLSSAKAEIERLQKENTILSQNADTAFQDGLNEAQDLYAKQVKAEIKSESYREFAERLRKKSKLKTVGHGEVASMFDEYEIDNLLKELVGEDDG